MSDEPASARSGPQRLAAVAFVCYLVVLTTATHWPKLDLGETPPSSDKALHLIAYGVWGLLAPLSGLFGPVRKPVTYAWVFAAGAIFAAVDEATQAIPGLRRHASLGDYIADILGLLLALGAYAIWGGFLRLRGR